MHDINEGCIGCRLANHLQDTYTVYEDEMITCLLDIAPLNEGHVLILPKKHYVDVDDMDEPTANAVMKASATIAKALKIQFHPDGISIIQNGGIFNELNHYHMHVFPRYEEDGFAWVEPAKSTLAKDRLAETKDNMIKHLRGK